jgi:serine/threonine-protein kinase RsbT
VNGPGHGERACVRVAIRREEDVAIARLAVRALAAGEGFSPERAAALATAVSEVAMNIVVHAGRPGEVRLEAVLERGRRAVVVTARDGSPGIADVAAAMSDGYSTGGGLGCGLPGARRLVDEFTLESAVGEGTVVTMKKWAHETR